jgi:oxygen-independent coproporphyrinogen III oxidase
MATPQDIPLPSEALLTRYDVAGPRYTSYPTVPTWRGDFGAEHLSERLGEAATAGPWGATSSQ